MAYLEPHFDHDVFVSYSHGDPRGNGRALLRDWTRALIGQLKGYMSSLEIEFDALHIWMDEDIDPTAHLTEELRAKVRASGILFVVMSQRYLVSSWCRDELKWFRKQVHERGAENGHVFVLRAQRTEVSQWPDFLRDEHGHAIPGFSFYDPDIGSPWGFPDLRETPREFAQEMSRLQMTLVKKLRVLRERAEKRAKATATETTTPPTSGPRSIYLHAPVGCEPIRAEIGRALKQDGILTLSANIEDGQRFANWERGPRDRMKLAKKCNALALLRTDDEFFVDDLYDIGIQERNRMVDARGAPLPCAVLDKTGADLPIDIAPLDIELFDVNRDGWRGDFRAWLDRGLAPVVAVPA